MDGPQLTALQPTPGCAEMMAWSQVLVSLKSSTLTRPSEEAQASRQPTSCGDQESRFTEAVCSAKSIMRVQDDVGEGELGVGVSRQMKTWPSYEEEARIVPYLGCACVMGLGRGGWEGWRGGAYPGDAPDCAFVSVFLGGRWLVVRGSELGAELGGWVLPLERFN